MPCADERRAKEQPLNQANDTVAVERLALAVLEREAVLQGGAHQIVEQLGVGSGSECGELPLGDQPVEVQAVSKHINRMS